MSNFKIFEIGFNKCATRAVYVLFRTAGIPSRHWDRGKIALSLERAKLNDEIPFDEYEGIRFFSDMVVSSRERVYEAYKDFKYLNTKFPDAKFVYNLRPKDDWINSRIKHGNGFELNVYKNWLGLKNNDEVIDFWSKDWDQHYQNVIKFFTETNQLDKLLFIDIGNPNFSDISNFLEVKVDPKSWEVVGKTK